MSYPVRGLAVFGLLLASIFYGCGGGSTGGGGNGGGGGTPPVTPTGLAATPGNQQVGLSWNAVSGATSYHIKRSATSGGPYTQVGAPTVTNLNDTSLINFTTYYYVVSAVNASGESANSAEVSARPLTIPAVPTGVVATAGDAQAALTWPAVTGADEYHIKRATISGGPYTQIGLEEANSAPNVTEFLLTNGTTYYFVISASNSAGESANSAQVSVTPLASSVDITITVNPSQTKAISPWIYGINFYHGITNVPANLTIDRAGGNRWTAYNWENNASNAGSDFFYQNDGFLGGGNTAGEAVRGGIEEDQTDGLASIVTFQLQGLVSADKNGTSVSVASPPDMSRFKTVVPKKSTVSAAAFTTTPSTSDANVYMDEFAWTLDQKLPGIFSSGATHPTFISLDNEPELWNSTHLEVQGATPISSDAYITKTITLTKALKDQFPDVVIFGPAHYGFLGPYNWQVESFSGGDWFTDKYLRAMKTASNTYGKRLVDVYDFHWYSEATDGTTRVTNMTGSTLTSAQVQAIVQSPRSLWDSTYSENSWIANDVLNAPINMLGRLQTKIDADWPGTKLSITEYGNGGDNHIAGTIAQADNLGIFGTQGLFAATFWPLSDAPYILAGFRAYRGFDGGNANFGDVSIKTTSSDTSKVAVYASSDSTTPGRYVFVAINRSTASQITAINGQSMSGIATIYRMTASSASGQSPVHPVTVGTMSASGSTLKITLPAMSVTTIEVK